MKLHTVLKGFVLIIDNALMLGLVLSYILIIGILHKIDFIIQNVKVLSPITRYNF